MSVHGCLLLVFINMQDGLKLDDVMTMTSICDAVKSSLFVLWLATFAVMSRTSIF
jgi:hypothetical protein